MTSPGVLVAGRYRLRTRVANGGMGSVWEAQDEVLGRRVAVKLLLPQPGISPADAETARSRVIREARITARLHHPHAVTLYDVVEHAGQPCLIMQFVPSRSLNAILQERGVLPEQQAARIGAELASALAAAHLAGIVHRDVKPSNVLITDDGSAKLTDFGISHAAGDVNLTSTGMVSGTPAYLAPEVARGAPSGFPADVFSLGATLYATLEGAPPFGKELNPMAILHRVASGQIIPPRRSGALTPLLLHMLAPVAAHRPTMSDVAAALAVPVDGSWAAAELGRPTTSLPSPTVHDWPADPPAPASLSSSLLGAGHLPDPPGTPPPAPRRSSATTPAPDRRRRSRLLGAVLALVLIGLAVLGFTLLAHRTGGSAGVAGTTGSGSGASSARSSAPRVTTPSRAAVPLPATAATPASGTSPSPTPRSSSSPSRPATSSTASRTTASSTSTSPTTSSTTRSTSSSTSTSTSSSTPTSSSAQTGAPTAARLAAAITDYYAGLPGGTDDGWAHLTPHFQSTIAKNRESYQAFWDGISTVSVSNASGTAPGTVEATISYVFKDGRRAVEDTRYQLVVSDGILKIDSSEVVSSQ